MIEYAELSLRLADFAAERDWDQFHTPKNLALALVGEVGELCELVQWKSDGEIGALLETSEFKEALSHEIADILIYLVRLASVVDVDLDSAVVGKIKENKRRYPASEVKGSSEKRP